MIVIPVKKDGESITDYGLKAYNYGFKEALDICKEAIKLAGSRDTKQYIYDFINVKVEELRK